MMILLYFLIHLGKNITISIDFLIESCHLFSNVDPIPLSHKALIVNLFDLVAMRQKQ